MVKSVFVTGGTGFLGVYLARRFLKAGWEVTLFDLAPLDAKDLIGKVRMVNGDVRNLKSVEAAVKGHDYVVHAAAALPILRTKKIIYSVNIDGTRNVLKASLIHKVKRLVFISTTAVYGVPKHLPERETSPLDPIGYYGESKVAGENLCLEFEKKGLEVNIIRPKTFLGPERLGVFSLWFEAIYNGHRIYILGNGKNKYQLLAVADVVEASYLALTKPVHGEIFNIGAKEFQTWRKDLEAIIKEEKSSSRVTGLPVKPSQIMLRLLEALGLSPLSAWHYMTMPVPSYVSTEKAERMLGWKATQSNKELLRSSYIWYKQNRRKLRGRKGDTHRVGWDFKILSLLSRF
jgi:nucleoside-diphosphate-sugar epimerase